MEDQEPHGDNDSHRTGTRGGEAVLKWKGFQLGCCFHGVVFSDDTPAECYGRVGTFQSPAQESPRIFSNTFLGAIILHLISIKFNL